MPDSLVPNSVKRENNLFTYISKGLLDASVCLNLFASVSQVWCQQSCSYLLFCGCCVWTFWVLTDTGPVWDGHYLWPCSGYCLWPRKEMKNLFAGWRIKSRGTKMSVLINLHGGSKSMTKSCFWAQSLPADVSKMEHLSRREGVRMWETHWITKLSFLIKSMTRGTRSMQSLKFKTFSAVIVRTYDLLLPHLPLQRSACAFFVITVVRTLSHLSLLNRPHICCLRPAGR